MFGSMVLHLAGNSLRRPMPLIFAAANFHRSVIRNKKKSPPYAESDCPETREAICIPLKKRYCSPTDPPVRPCSEQDCLPRPRYPCCVNTRIARDPCAKSEKKSDFIKKKEQFVSMWETITDRNRRPDTILDYPPECCPVCADVRFDVLYYRPSDKCREYQRTWWECCPRMVPKRVCCWCDAVPPQVERRCLPLCPRSACNDDHEKMRIDCLSKKSKDCMRLRLPCCRSARFPPTCNIRPSPSDCQKIKCPFPSFSECMSEGLATLPERPPECRCLNALSKCEGDRYSNRLDNYCMKMTTCH